MPRILCYSPYGKWYVHTLYEATILHAARLRGADIKVMACDGLFRECDIHWRILGPRPADACHHCQLTTLQLYYDLQLTPEWFGHYLNVEDRQHAERFVARIARDALPSATFNGYPVGHWTASSIHSHFRLSRLDLDDPDVEATYRALLSGAVLAVLGFTRLLDDYRPDSMLLLNGRFFTHRVAFELARERGVYVVCHERGFRKSTLMFAENGIVHDLGHPRRIWETWGHVPLSRADLEDAHRYVMARKHGTDTSWYSFSQPPQEVAALRVRLGSAAYDKVLAVFSASDDEFGSIADWRGPYPEQRVWIEDTIRFACAHPGVLVVIRVHPNVDSPTHLRRNSQQMTFFEALAPQVPANVRVIMPRDEANSHVLMEIADAAVTFTSTTGLEMATLGKPALYTNPCYYSDLPAVETLRERKQYPAALEALLARRPSLRTMQYAYRAVSYLQIKRSVPFSKVSVEVLDGKLNYASLAELLPGKDEALDHIVNALLARGPLDPGPTPDDEARSPYEELSFLSAVFPGAPALTSEGR